MSAEQKTEKAKKKVYIVFDVETDGQSFAKNNMIALSFVLVKDSRDLTDETNWLMDSQTFYFNPIDGHEPDEQTMKEFWSKHLDIYQKLTKEAEKRSSSAEMLKLHEYFVRLTQTYEVKWVAKPASFDFAWLHSYCHHFLEPSEAAKIGHSCICISTMEKDYKRLDGDIQVMETALAKYPLTHDPADDAKRQAYQFLWLHNTLDTYRKGLKFLVEHGIPKD